MNNARKLADSTSEELTYAIVIATRNRVDALRISLPLMLEQSRRPKQIVIVDSSDDPTQVGTLVDGIQSDIPIHLLRSEPGTSLQRNLGVGLISESVTFFLDDDSMLFQDTAEHIMRVYEQDFEQRIGGVCSSEALHSTLHIESAKKPSMRDQVKLRVAAIRRKLEDATITDPFIRIGRSNWPESQEPNWFDNENVVPVEYMTGFRMTFRTKVIHEFPFDEHLRRYGLFEDIDASLRVSMKYRIVGANKARIFHNRWKGNRDQQSKMGFFSACQ